MSKPSEKFNKLSKLYKKNLIPKDQYEREMPYVYEEAIERNLLLNKISPYYDIDCKLETVYGRYSNVMNYQSKEGKTLSLRIMKKKDEGIYEPEWQNMRHKNIVTILSRNSYQDEDAVCYLSAYMQYSLKQVVNSEDFKYSKQASMFLTKWLKDIASGLEYIHSKEFAHTNITANNISIEDTLVAKITDFHFLNTTKQASNRIGLKYSNRPPESFSNSDGSSPVDCTKVDVWSLGILTVNIFTGMVLERKLSDDVSNWSTDVYSQIFKVLKKKKFNKLHRKYLKYASASDNLKSARSFAAFCLHFEPIERPSVKDILRHDLMNKSGFLPEKDKMWHRKVHWKKIENQISLLKPYEESYEDRDVELDAESSPYPENADNSNVMENTTSLTNKIKLEFEGENQNIEEICQVIDIKENPPNCLSGDTERNMLIEDNTLYNKERILEPSQEDKYTDIDNEGDRLADLLLSLSEFRHDSADIADESDVNVKEQQPKKHVDNTEISENIENMKTTLVIEDKQNTDYFSIASKAEKNSEDDRVADLLISLSESHVHAINDEKQNIVIANENLKNQKETTTSEKNTTEIEDEINTNIEIQDFVNDSVTEEIKMSSLQITQIKPEEEIKQNNTSVTDFHKQNKAGKGRSYWNHEVGMYLLNFFIDNNSSNGMLHPENYLFKLVQKL